VFIEQAIRARETGAVLFQKLDLRRDYNLLAFGKPASPGVEFVGVFDLSFHLWNIT